MASVLTPFELLKDIAVRSRKHAAGLPAQLKAGSQDSGIGFRLGEFHLYAPMGEIAEILPVPPFTQLPGVRSWIKGVANVRGRLLPIIDLGLFLGKDLSSHKKKRRIMVVEFGEVFAGLIVDEVFGMQHFDRTAFSCAIPMETPELLQPYLAGNYQSDMDQWLVFSLFSLASHPQFMQVAV